MAFALACLLLSSPVFAQHKFDGYFIAFQGCEAFKSKNTRSNPGDVSTDVMRAYEMIGINKVGGDFYQIKIPGAPDAVDRWVHASCGEHAVVAGTRPDAAPPPVMPDQILGDTGPEGTDNLLALSWQAAFCESRPSKVECQKLNAAGLQ